MSDPIVVIFILFFVLLATTTPIAVALGLTSFGYIFFFTSLPLTQIPEILFNSINSFSLMAVPFFVLAAYVMTDGGISERIIDASNAVVGHFKGGLAVTSVLSCVFFAAISGSSPATVVAVGTLMMPAMVRAGYGREFSTGIVATSGSLGILIPPSIALIVLGIATEQSVGDLFLAGILPGLMAGALIILLVIVLSRRQDIIVRTVAMPMKARLRAFQRASLSLFLPIFILGGIYGGVFTPTEAAAMAVLYSLVVAMLIYREIKPRDLVNISLRAARMSAMVLFIIANAHLFSFVLASERIPGQVADFLIGSGLSSWQYLLIVNVVLLIVGAFMDTVSAIVILAPIMFPAALALGVDPIHFGIIMVMNLEIGLITPPLGVNLFVASGMSGLPSMQVARGALPSGLVLLLALLLVTYIPFISLALVH